MQALPYLPLSPIIERIDSGCISNLMRVLIRLLSFYRLADQSEVG